MELKYLKSCTPLTNSFARLNNLCARVTKSCTRLS